MKTPTLVAVLLLIPLSLPGQGKVMVVNDGASPLILA
jgi:hypothetical protein